MSGSRASPGSVWRASPRAHWICEPDEAAELLRDAPVAALPISAGQGFISRFSESVASICRHVGCDAWVTPHPDVAGLAEAAEAGARLVFAADEERFIALNITTGVVLRQR